VGAYNYGVVLVHSGEMGNLPEGSGQQSPRNEPAEGNLDAASSKLILTGPADQRQIERHGRNSLGDDPLRDPAMGRLKGKVPGTNRGNQLHRGGDDVDRHHKRSENDTSIREKPAFGNKRWSEKGENIDRNILQAA